MRRARALGVALLCAAISILGVPSAWAVEDEGLLRVAHLSPDTPAVDVYVDSVADPDAGVTLPRIDYGTMSGYQHLAAGTYTVSLRSVGATPTTPPVLSTTVEVAPGSPRTVAGVGLFADLGLAILDDDVTPPPPGSARVRVVTGSATAGPVDVALSAGPPVASALALGRESGYVDVPAGRPSLRVTSGDGTASDLPLPVVAGSIYTVLLLDRPGGGLTVQPVLDAGSPAVVPVGGVEAGAGGASEGFPGALVPLGAATLATAVLLAAAGGRLRLERAGPGMPRDRELVAGPRRAGRRRAVLTRVRLALALVAAISGGTALALPSDGSSVRAAPTPAVPVAATGAPPALTTAPTWLRIPSLGIDGPLAALGVDAAGALAPPEDFGEAGWFAAGIVPGEIGPAVIAGHVDSYTGPAVFFRLADLAPGDEVLVDRADGTTVRFAVTRVARHPKDAFPTDEVYGPTSDAELRLITCGGDFDRNDRRYVDNVVVDARLTGRS